MPHIDRRRTSNTQHGDNDNKVDVVPLNHNSNILRCGVRYLLSMVAATDGQHAHKLYLSLGYDGYCQRKFAKCRTVKPNVLFMIRMRGLG